MVILISLKIYDHILADEKKIGELSTKEGDPCKSGL